MANQDKLTQLIAKVKQATISGKVKWECTANDSAFSVTLPAGGAIFVERNSDSDQEANNDWRYRICVYDTQGRLVEESERTLAAYQEFFDLARRSALNTEAVLDNLIDSLNHLNK